MQLSHSRRPLRALLAAALLSAAPSLASFAQWTDRFSYSGCSLSAVADGVPVCGNSTALFYYDSAQDYVGRLTKVNRLSSVGISALAADDGRLIVGYSDGGIDIVDMTEMITASVPELKLSESVTSKVVNAICVSGGRAYCATSGGVLELDLRKNEVRSFWRIVSGGVSASAVCVAGGRVYVGTADGVYCASLGSRMLEDFSQWDLLDAPQGNVVSLAASGDAACAAVGSLGGDCALWRIEGKEAEAHGTFSSFRGLAASGESVAVTQSGRVAVFDSSLKSVANVSAVKSADGAEVVTSPAFRSASFLPDGSLAVADANVGLVVTSLSGVGKSFLPDGPASNNVGDIFSKGGDVYFAGPGRNASYNNQGNVTSFSVLHDDDQWTSCRASSYSYGREPAFFAADPVSGQIYLSTFGTGVFTIDDYQLGQKFNSENSPLAPAWSDYVRTDAIVVDKKQNLIVLNNSVSDGIKVMTRDGEWYSYSYGPMSVAHSALGMITTANNNLWLWSSRMSTPFLCVFNLNGTPETGDDDVFMTTSGTGKESESNCLGVISLTDASSGEDVGSRATAVAASADGSVWVGTTGGLLVTQDNSTMLKTGEVTFNRVKVPRNDGSGLADYLLDGQFINDIKVDGADRKWVATDNGAYLVSSDGLTTIHHFTSADSPLPSDNVLHIGIRESDGEVFFGTDAGVVSRRGDAIQPSSKLSKIKIFPNPVSASGSSTYVGTEGGPGYVTMTGFEASSSIFITDVAGNRVFRTTSLGGMASWDLRREGGSRVANGVYLVWATNSEGKTSAVGKILVTE